MLVIFHKLCVIFMFHERMINTEQ